MNCKNLLIISDLEGACFIERFSQTRKIGKELEIARHEHTEQLNAILNGIYQFNKKMSIHIWDSHGIGGLVPEKLLPVKKVIPPKRLFLSQYIKQHDIHALLFESQHAMNHTKNGNLCHTMSSRRIDAYILNGEMIGEIGIRALIAGENGIPVIYLSGDDKACIEAEKLIPAITTTITKYGTSRESAKFVDKIHLIQSLTNDVGNALSRFPHIKPIHAQYPIELTIKLRLLVSICRFIKNGCRLKKHTFHAPTLNELEVLKIL